MVYSPTLLAVLECSAQLRLPDSPTHASHYYKAETPEGLKTETTISVSALDEIIRLNLSALFAWRPWWNGAGLRL